MPKNPTNPRPVRPVPPGATTRQVRARYGDVSAMWVERKLKNDSDFPRPEFFGTNRFFRIAALEAYERACAKRPRARGVR
jgi:hypothetical protein